MWFGPHAAHGTVFVPIPSGAGDVPPPYRIGRQSILDRRSAFWAFRFVENLANLKFSHAIQDIQAAQAPLEKQGDLLVDRWRSKGGNLTAAVHRHAAQVLEAWWLLGDLAPAAQHLVGDMERGCCGDSDQLMAKYADGYVTIPAGGHDVSTATGYPAWWLAAVGYPAGPPEPG